MKPNNLTELGIVEREGEILSFNPFFPPFLIGDGRIASNIAV